MAELAQAVVDGVRALSAWEAVAVLLAIGYLVLAIRQNRWCWPAALASAAIYLWLMFEARLYMQSALQLFYMGMAVYGWVRWRGGSGGASLAVRSWTWREHRVPLLLIILPGLALGWLLAGYSDAAHPYLDALAATGAIVTTWMVAQKVLQNWHYWFVIDLVSAGLYAAQGLWLTAVLFLFYLVLVVVGYRQWRASMVSHG